MGTESLTESLRETLALFDNFGEPRTTPEIAECLDLGRRSTYARLERLVEHNQLKTKKVGANARVWWRPPPKAEVAESDWSAAAETYGKELPQQRDFTQQILETIPIGVLAVEPDGTFTTANQRAVELLELESNNDDTYSVGVNEVYDEDGKFLAPDDRPYVQAFETGESVRNWHARLESSNGGWRWVSTNIEPMANEEGDIERVLVTIEDVSQLKGQAALLERQRDELESEIDEIFGRVSDAFYALDDEWRFTHANKRAAKLIGFEGEELVGKNIWETFEADVPSKLRDEYERAMKTQESISFELYFPEPYQDWFEINAYPSETGLSVYFQEITERKERERALRENEHRYRTLIENFPDGAVALFDEELRYIAAGGELLDQLEISSDDAVGESIYERYPDELVETIEPHFQAALEGERSSVEVEYYGRDLYASLLPVGKEEVFSGMLLVQDITERKERERELERQREQLMALNSINKVVGEITDTAIDQSTREEIEQVVCEALASSDTYEFAWLAQVDLTTDTIEPCATARTRGYADEIEISMNLDDPTGGGPGATAIREQETQIVQDVFSDPSFEPWREAAAEYGFNSVASIPIVHEGTVYGVLGVYSDRPNAFATAEREIISRLGEVVGHAIAAVERKQALVSDELVELEFQIQDIFTTLDTPIEAAGTITFDHVIPLNDGEFLVYGTATPDAIDTLPGLVETLSHWEDITIHSQSNPASFELRLTDSSALSAVASLGGYIEQAVIECGDYQLTTHFAPNADVRQVIDAIEAAYSQVEMLRRQQITRSPADPQRVQQQLMADLTNRQRAALDASYHAGFFEWPRRSSGEEVAESLGVAPTTFHQHLRKAERKVFDSLYSTSGKIFDQL
jgi:HTH-type transcriptional regulator, bacterioopsin transcriptional activator and related proteins